MIPSARLYQDFGTESQTYSDPRAELELEVAEEGKLQAFENGYQAGWEDAVKAQSDLEKSISSELSANLQDASFQYHELRTKLNQVLENMLREILDTLLPEIAKHSLAPHIQQHIQSLGRDVLDGSIELVVHPDMIEKISPLITDAAGGYQTVGDPNLTPAQAYIRFHEREEKVDLAEVLSAVRSAVTEFFQNQMTEVQNG